MFPSWLLLLMKVLITIVSVLVWPITRILALRHKECPLIQNPLLMHSAKKLARMIRHRQVSCAEVVRAYVIRAKEVNPVLNAIVEARFELALQEAEQVDNLLEMNSVSNDRLQKETPLLGVPITLKESIAVKGMSNQAGRFHPEKVIAAEDADVVRKVRTAGAIPILVSNTPELCMFWETYNNVTGKTMNPYDTRRTAGGSSGGEAVLLGSGASVIGLGSDIGGSLRLPAMFNGVFGHKPTPWTVSTEGHKPGCVSPDWADFFTIGPMTRYAEDLPLLMSIIAEDDKKKSLRLDDPVPMTKIKVFYMESDGHPYLTNKIDSSVIQAMHKYVSHLELNHGIIAQKVTIPEMKNAFEVAVSILMNIEGVETIFYNKDDPMKITNVWSEVFKFFTFRSHSIFPVVMYGIMKKFSTLMKKRVSKNVELNNQIKDSFAKLLGDDGVLLYPTFPGSAHFHYQMYYKLLNIAYMAIFNTLGLPVTNCPTGFNAEGMPIGFQVVTNPYNDRLSFTLAADIEDYFGGWKPPRGQLYKFMEI